MIFIALKFTKAHSCAVCIHRITVFQKLNSQCVQVGGVGRPELNIFDISYLFPVGYICICDFTVMRQSYTVFRRTGGSNAYLVFRIGIAVYKSPCKESILNISLFLEIKVNIPNNSALIFQAHPGAEACAYILYINV